MILEKKLLFHILKGKDIKFFAKTTGQEVVMKTRSSKLFGSPSAAVDSKKMQHMVSAAETWLSENPVNKEIRFDVSEVYAKIIDLMPVYDEINYISGIVIN